MKLYHNDGVWQIPGKQDKGATRVDVPQGQPGLAEWLNDRNVPAFPVFEAESVASGDPPCAYCGERTVQGDCHDPQCKANKPLTQPTEAAIAAKVSQFKTDEIVEFILDKASVGQVERILACLGTRFAEHLQETRA